MKNIFKILTILYLSTSFFQILPMEIEEYGKVKSEANNQLESQKIKNLIDSLKEKINSNFIKHGIFGLFSDITNLLDKELDDIVYCDADGTLEYDKKFIYKQVLENLKDFVKDEFMPNQLKNATRKQLNSLLFEVIKRQMNSYDEKNEKRVAQLIIAGASLDLGLGIKIRSSGNFKIINILEIMTKSNKFTKLTDLVQVYTTKLSFMELPYELHWTIINQAMKDIIQCNYKQKNGIFEPLKGIKEFIKSVKGTNRYFSSFDIDGKLIRTAKRLAAEHFAPEEVRLTQGQLDEKLQNMLILMTKVDCLTPLGLSEEEKNKKLQDIQSIDEANVLKIARLIIAGANPNLSISYYDRILTPLILLAGGYCQLCYKQINFLINLLLDYGANIDYQDNKGGTALWHAYEEFIEVAGTREVVLERLIDKKANVNLIVEERSILDCVLTNNELSTNLMKKIIDNGADTSVIKYSLQEMNAEFMDTVKYIQSVEDNDEYDYFVFPYLEKLIFLMQYGIDITSSINTLDQALKILINSDYDDRLAIDILKFFLEYGINMNNLDMPKIQDIALKSNKLKLINFINSYLTVENIFKRMIVGKSIIEALKKAYVFSILNNSPLFEKHRLIAIAKRIAKEHFASNESSFNKEQLNKRLLKLLQGECNAETEEKIIKLILCGAKCDLINVLTIDKFSNVSDLLVYYYNNYFTIHEQTLLLIQAIKQKDLRVAKALLINKYEHKNYFWEYEDDLERNLLLIAVEEGNSDIVQLILKYSEFSCKDLELARERAKELKNFELAQKIKQENNMQNCLMQ